MLTIQALTKFTGVVIRDHTTSGPVCVLAHVLHAHETLAFEVPDLGVFRLADRWGRLLRSMYEPNGGYLLFGWGRFAIPPSLGVAPGSRANLLRWQKRIEECTAFDAIRLCMGLLEVTAEDAQYLVPTVLIEETDAAVVTRANQTAWLGNSKRQRTDHRSQMLAQASSAAILSARSTI